MKQITTANKLCSNRVGLYNLALDRLKECEKSKGEIIKFPQAFEKLCRSFSIKKSEAFEILFILQDFNQIEIVPYHGLRIKNE